MEPWHLGKKNQSLGESVLIFYLQQYTTPGDRKEQEAQHEHEGVLSRPVPYHVACHFVLSSPLLFHSIPFHYYISLLQ